MALKQPLLNIRGPFVVLQSSKCAGQWDVVVAGPNILSEYIGTK